ERFPDGPPAPALRRERIALLGSSSIRHLVPGIRIAALRRGIWAELFATEHGSHMPLLLAAQSPLDRFAPSTVVFAFDARFAADGGEQFMAETRSAWRLAKDRHRCDVIQQTLLPVPVPLIGNNEHRHAESAARRVAELNRELRAAADEDGVDLVAVDAH